MTKKEILKYIESRDPDGGSRQPTEAERQEFHNWIIDFHGQEMLDTYLASGWDDDCE
jgi:hypothetical protein